MLLQGRTAGHGRGRGRGPGGAGLCGPLGVDGGVTGEHGSGGDPAAAHRLGVPAVEGVAVHRGRLRQGGQFAVQIGGDHHGGAHTAAGVQTDGIKGVLFISCGKGGRHCRTQQAEQDQTECQCSEDFFHKIPHFPGSNRAPQRLRCLPGGGGIPARP